MGTKLKTVDSRPMATGQLKVLQRLNPYEFGVELWLLRDGENRNKWSYQNIDKYYKTFVGQPILIAYVMGKIGDGHNSRLKIDPRTGEEYYSYTDATAERIVGTLSDDERDFSLQKRDGQTWIVAKGRLFAFYAKETVDEIVRTGRMDVSVETLTYESHMEGDVEVITNFRGIGVTILGAGVAPAVPGANIARLAALNEEFKTLKLKAASLQKAPDTNDAPDSGSLSQEGVNKLKTYNKRQLAELAARFTDYKVLAAGEKDGKVFVCLMAKDGAYKYYVIENAAETIVPERYQNMSVNTTMQMGEDCITMEAQDFMELVGMENTDRLNAAESKVNSLSQQLATANAQIDAMREFEDKRRLNAAKDKAKATLAKFNSNREQKVSESEIAPILTDIEAGLYTNKCDKDRNWIGEAEVARAVYAVCGEAVERMDAEKANRNKTVYAWDKFNQNSGEADDGTLAGLFAKWGVEAFTEK